MIEQSQVQYAELEQKYIDTKKIIRELQQK
jgi:hypothetical protein